MRGPRDVSDYLKDMLDYAEKAIRLTEGMDFRVFAKDERTNLAVIRCLEVIGEAAKKIPASFRNHHNDVPWAEAAGIRDILIHDYISVNLGVVWKTVHQDLPVLRTALSSLLKP
jgi:uncharacterized protein with HEPN domain